MYCAAGIGEPSGNCTAGYYCIGGASVHNPMDGSSGDICPAGFYCPSGSYWPTPCPLGTYSDSVQNEQLEDCHACSYGEYCGQHNMTEPSGE